MRIYNGYIFTHEVNEFKENIAKLNKKYGCEIVDVEYIEIPMAGFADTVTRVILKINNPNDGKYNVIAMIDHNNGIINAREDINLEKYRDRRVCDHCNTNRVRNTTFIVQTKDGLMQIGSSCLQKLMGRTYTKNLYNFFTNLFNNNFEAENIEFDPDMETLMKREREVYYAEDIINVAYRYLKKNNFVSISKADSFEESSAHKVAEILLYYDKTMSYAEGEDINIEDFKKFLREQVKKTYSNFYENCVSIIRKKEVDEKAIRWLVPCVYQYLRYKENQKNASKGFSEHKPYGKDGEVFNGEMKGEVTYVNTYENDYGLVDMIIFDCGEHKFNWYTTSAHGLEKGDKVTLTKFKVKSNKNPKYTTITYTKFKKN